LEVTVQILQLLDLLLLVEVVVLVIVLLLLHLQTHLIMGVIQEVQVEALQFGKVILVNQVEVIRHQQIHRKETMEVLIR
jgi:cell division protein FtsB